MALENILMFLKGGGEAVLRIVLRKEVKRFESNETNARQRKRQRKIKKKKRGESCVA
jgi:hypothetical protein